MSYLKFVEVKFKSKTKEWQVTNLGGGVLGSIEWCGTWGKYCFFPMQDTFYDFNCLMEIAELIKTKMSKRSQYVS